MSETPETRADQPSAPPPVDDASVASALELTELAAEKVQEIRQAEGIEDDFGLRVKVMGGGCAGFRYDLFFDEPSASDYVFESNSVKMVCDQMSYMYLMGTTIDYIDGPYGSGFRFDNPNTTGSCGCGSSMSS
jgi:iron-sulfur cluster insertion protein